MELPRSIPYNPSGKGVLFCSLFFGTGALFMGHQALHNDRGLIVDGFRLGPQGATIFYWIISAASFAFVALALLALWRRQFHPRTLELAADALLLPHGFFQLRITRIPYAGIAAAQEQEVSRQRFLNLFTPHGKFTVTAGLFPDKRSYEEVRDFLVGMLQRGSGQAATGSSYPRSSSQRRS